MGCLCMQVQAIKGLVWMKTSFENKKSVLAVLKPEHRLRLLVVVSFYLLAMCICHVESGAV